MSAKNNNNGLRVNREIRIPTVRVIASDGKQLGVMITKKALELASEEGMDLVEISPKSQPPVCRIMNFGKYKYDLSKKNSEARKNQTKNKTKQVKLRPKTDIHDRTFKVKNARKFLLGGNKVQFEVQFRGRENAHLDKGKELLDQIAKDLEDVCSVERTPSYENKSMFMIVTPK